MIKKTIAILALATAGLLTAACGGGGDPESISLDLEVHDRQLVGHDVVSAKKGDTVALNWTADESVTIHLHGYDIEETITPGETTTFAFTADIEGHFLIEAHGFGAADSDHHDGGATCEATVPVGAPEPSVHLSVTPGHEPGEYSAQVETENIVLADGQGHWHLYVDGALRGMFAVPEAEVMLADGEHQLMATLSDGTHCEYPGKAMVTVHAEGSGEEEAGNGHEDGGSHGNGEESEEVALGFFDVLPR